MLFRLHLDPRTIDNGPVRVIGGTHRLGRLGANAIDRIRAERAESLCLAAEGTTLAFRPLLLHGSSAAARPAHRRVIHVEFAARGSHRRSFGLGALPKLSCACMLTHVALWRYYGGTDSVEMLTIRIVSYTVGLAFMASAACATSSRGSGGDTVPRSAGMLAATQACRVTGAWTVDGQRVAPPAVLRCVLPRYPESMRDARQEGEIVWRVTVDSTGLVDSASVRVMRTSASALVDAVRQAAPYLRFAAPGVHRSVIIELPTTFQLTP